MVGLTALAMAFWFMLGVFFALFGVVVVLLWLNRSK